MEAPLAQDDRRAVARRLFVALCAQYPDRHIALIEQPGVASRSPAAETATANAAERKN
jgi:hypothetical protein